MKKLIGKIVSDKMDKSRMVEIIDLRIHPIYQTSFKVSNKIMAHDEKNESKMGDVVEIVPRSPKSRRKAWQIKRKVK